MPPNAHISTSTVPPAQAGPFLYPESQHLSDSGGLDEELRQTLLEPLKSRWRARAADGHLTPTQRNYAQGRANSLSKPYSNRLVVCGQFGSTFACGCPGSASKRWFTCRQHLMCPDCAKRRGLTQKNRIRHALLNQWDRRAEREAGYVFDDCDCERKGIECRGRGNGSRKTMAVMLTLTLRDTGDVAHDLAALERGWRAFYKRYHARYGSFPYVAVDEITAGTRGIGHAHKHVVVLWPYRCWAMLQRWWVDACPESTRINMVPAYSVRGAAKYIAKYTAKGVDTAEWTPQLRTRVVCAYYNKKLVQTSEGFWLRFKPVCPTCGQSHREVRLPSSWVAAIIDARAQAQAPPQAPRERDGDGGCWRQVEIELGR